MPAGVVWREFPVPDPAGELPRHPVRDLHRRTPVRVARVDVVLRFFWIVEGVDLAAGMVGIGDGLARPAAIVLALPCREGEPVVAGELAHARHPPVFDPVVPVLSENLTVAEGQLRPGLAVYGMISQGVLPSGGF